MRGYAKEYTNDLIYSVAKKFNVRGMTRKHVVPHITLFGPFTTDNEKQVVETVVEVAKRYRWVPLKVKGFDYFEGQIKGFFGSHKGKVVYLDIEPSSELEELRWELAKRLSTCCTTRHYDAKKDFKFHATVAFKDIDKKFKEIWAYIKERETPDINQYMLRITIIKNSRILYEYDLLQQELLTREQALSKYYWRKTINLLNSASNKMDKPDSGTCGYHLCGKKTTVSKCSYCKYYFCDEHLKPKPAGPPIFSSTSKEAKAFMEEWRNPMGHPCPPYYPTWIGTIKGKEDRWPKFLDEFLRRPSQIVFIPTEPTEKKLTPPKSPPLPPQPSQRPPLEPHVENRCLECSKSIPTYLKYCGSCYQRHNPIKENTCLGCGRSIPKDQKYCASCQRDHEQIRRIKQKKMLLAFLIIFVVGLLVYSIIPTLKASPFLNCADGTLHGRCSADTSLYCSNGTLVTNVTVCGCPIGYEPFGQGYCRPTAKCTDGTRYDECSTTKPLYCMNGQLIDKATKCGCMLSSDLEQVGDNCVSKYRQDPVNRTFSWKFRDRRYALDVTLYGGLYNYYFSQSKRYTCYDDACSIPDSYFSEFVNEQKQHETIKEIVRKIRGYGLSEEDTVRLLLAFVIQIPYDDAKLDSPSGGMNYPYETLYLDRGLCGDKALLAASLLKELGYGVVLFYYPPEEHMTIGIKCPKRYSSYGSDYCFVEVSSGIYNRVTDIPKEYGRFGGIILLSNPEMYVVSDGKSFDSVYTDVEEVEEFKYTERRMTELEALLKSERYGDINTYNALVYEYNALVEKYEKYTNGE